MENEDQRAPLPDAARRAQARTDPGGPLLDVAWPSRRGRPRRPRCSMRPCAIHCWAWACVVALGDARVAGVPRCPAPCLRDRPGGAGRSRPGRRKDEPCSSARRPGLEPTRQRAPGRRARSVSLAPNGLGARHRARSSHDRAGGFAGEQPHPCGSILERWRLPRDPRVEPGSAESWSDSGSARASGSRSAPPPPTAWGRLSSSGRPMPCRGAFASDSREQERATCWRCPDCTSDSWRRGSRSPSPVPAAGGGGRRSRSAWPAWCSSRRRRWADAESLQRAAVTALAALLLPLRARPGHPVPRPDGWAVLGLALAWQVLAEPGSVHAVGTQLTFTATAGLLRGATRPPGRRRAAPERRLRFGLQLAGDLLAAEPEPDGPRASRAFP